MDWYLFAVVVVCTFCLSIIMFVFGLKIGSVTAYRNMQEEMSLREAERKQQQMWNDYLNALKEGKNGR